MKLKHVIILAVVVAALLMVPLVAMQFTDEVVWTAFDFVFAGVVLFGAGITFLYAASRAGNGAYKLAAGLAVFSTLALVWVNAAVGLIGGENNPLNMMYLAVPLVGLIGAGVANFKPRGMMYALFAMAVAQVAIPIIAFLTVKMGTGSTEALMDLFRLFGASGFFAFWFVLAGLIFRHADSANRELAA